MAMLFLVILTTLSVAMFSLATTNLQSASNLSDAERSRAAAESGLRWMSYRFMRMSRPKTTVGNITPSVASNLWPQIVTSITNDLATLTNTAERTVTVADGVLESSPISLDGSDARFTITVEQLPYYITDPSDGRYRHSIKVTSTGTCNGASRTMSMVFRLDKKVNFAVVGKVPLQFGKNTIVEGPVAMATAGKYPPILALSDFRNIKASLTTKVDAFQAFLEANHKRYDNRIAATDTAAWTLAQQAGYRDRNADNYIDEYDLFVYEFDSNGDKAITKAEFTNPSTGKLYDAELFAAMDTLGGPLYDGDTTRQGYKDDRIDNYDAYAKIRGQVSLATTADAWSSNLSGQGKTIYDMMGGPLTPPRATDTAVKFGANSADIFDLSPTNFNTSTFRTQSGPDHGATVVSGSVFTNKTLAATDANGGTATERTPLGSTSYQATYKRPVFRDKTFRNCRIPKGLNALFENCKFEGVTFVELETQITNSSGQVTTSQTDAMTWSKKMKSGSFNKDTALTSTNSYGFDKGNNLRFNDCTFNGPVASDVPTAYSHFTNSWEFTGKTYFDNVADQTATIVAPQTNIEMGSFTDPTAAPSTLIGVVVAGNIDIRGTSNVDGSIVVTGDGAGNTTLGWFGASDSETNPSALPEGGFGRLNIRYNPYRALPDGINIAVDILPDTSTYSER